MIVMIKTQHHSSEWYTQFVEYVQQMPDVVEFYRMAGEFDYMLQVEVVDMKCFDHFTKTGQRCTRFN